MAIFLQCAKWTGDVDTAQYRHWVRCHSFEFGVSNDIRSAILAGNNRMGTHATVSEVTLTKGLDPASQRIFLDAVSGTISPLVEIAFTIADSDNTAYLRVKLGNSGVSKWTVSSTGERPVEAFTLAFATIELTEATQDQSGKTVGNVTVGYDLARQRPS